MPADPVDSLRYGPIKGPETHYTQRPVRRFKNGWQDIWLPPPPKNSSVQTQLELKQVKKAVESVTPEMQQDIAGQDERLEAYFEDLLSEAGVQFSPEDIDDLTSELAAICQHFKVNFDRPRPAQLFDYFGMAVPTMESEVALTPAYPSGHAFAAWFLALYFTQKYPTLKPQLEALAEEIGQNRIKAGLHYPSDYDGGVRLAKAVLPFFKG
jgi:acid phosphatase (class A)